MGSKVQVVLVGPRSSVARAAGRYVRLQWCSHEGAIVEIATTVAMLSVATCACVCPCLFPHPLKRVEEWLQPPENIINKINPMQPKQKSKPPYSGLTLDDEPVASVMPRDPSCVVTTSFQAFV